jgi:hypothetical protein
VSVRCRDWCIRSTLFMHSTALLARPGAVKSCS